MGEPAHGGAQHGQQGDVLPPVVDDPEQVQHHHDLHGLEIAPGELGVAGDAGEGQRPGEDAGMVHAPEEDGEVPVPIGPGVPLRLLPVELAPHEPPDAPGAEAGLRLGVLHVLGVLRVLSLPALDEVQLHRPLGLGHAGAQGRLLVVDDGALAGLHELLEDPVHRVQHLRAAAEVVVEVDPVSGIAGEGPKLLQKQPRFRHAEAVDALLHVPNEEQVIAPLDPVQDGLLDGVAVLVLVHDDGREPVPILRRGLLVLQYFRAEVLEIVEVDPIPLPLHAVVDPLLPPPQVREGQQHPGALQLDLPELVPVLAVDALLPLDLLFHPVPRVLQRLPIPRIHVFGPAVKYPSDFVLLALVQSKLPVQLGKE